MIWFAIVANTRCYTVWALDEPEVSADQVPVRVAFDGYEGRLALAADPECPDHRTAHIRDKTGALVEKILAASTRNDAGASSTCKQPLALNVACFGQTLSGLKLDRGPRCCVSHGVRAVGGLGRLSLPIPIRGRMPTW
jgi:hypothetical protein